MESIKVTYKLTRCDSARFHGWIIWECCGKLELEYFKTTSLEEAKAALHELDA